MPSATLTVPPPYTVEDLSHEHRAVVNETPQTQSPTVSPSASNFSRAGGSQEQLSIHYNPPPSQATSNTSRLIPNLATTPGADPFVEALQQTADVREMVVRSMNNPESQTRRMGELVIRVSQLLEKAHNLKAITAKDRKRHLAVMLDNVLQVQAKRPAVPIPLRQAVWRTAGLLLETLADRISAAHLACGIEIVTKSILNTQEIINQANIFQ